MTTSISLSQCLPALSAFVRHLSDEYQNGNLTGWPQFRAACEVFYSLQQLAGINSVIPGWQKMASYDRQQTLIHVTAVLAGLYSLPEYQACDAHQQMLIEWIVLWHDIAKEAHPDKRDHTHGFRSAAVTGKGLPSLGFAVQSAYPIDFDAWYQQTHSAVTYSAALNDSIQDHRQLPDIITGIDRLFARDAALIIKGVLLHMSLTVVERWPAAAPLTDDEIRRFISPELVPLLRVMMMADNLAWSLFDSDRAADELQQIRAEFKRIEAMLKP